MQWRHTSAPLEERHLAGAEQLLGVLFPLDYRECLRRNHGAAPNPAGFLVSSSDKERPYGSGVGVLLTIDPYAPENLFATLSHLAADKQLPPGVIPIADDGGGDMVCLDYRATPTGATPSIVYWSHELEGDEALTPLASTFTEFLQLLEDHKE